METITTVNNTLIVTDEAKRVETRWYVQRGMDRDIYDVFVIRYTIKLVNGAFAGPNKTEYLNLNSEWEECLEGERVVPCLTLKGNLVHILNQVGAFDFRDVEESLQKLCSKIVTGTLDVLTGKT